MELDHGVLGKKTDRRDAHELARRLLLGDIDQNAKIYYPSDQQYGYRKLPRRPSAEPPGACGRRGEEGERRRVAQGTATS